MRVSIEHQLHYTYSRPVFVEPMTLRLMPASNPFQRCETFELTVHPPPRGTSAICDCGGNGAHTLWFDGEQAALEIVARSVVTTLCGNPFDYLIATSGALRLPMIYEPSQAAELVPCLGRPAVNGGPLGIVVDAVRRNAGDRTADFLLGLCARLHADLRCSERPEGDPWPAAQTLARGGGACRDLAVVFIEACRRVGLAARFVSGYKLDPFMLNKPVELHAWAEVYLPGAGWRGYDPSIGLAVADRHVMLAAAHTPALAAPTQGSFRGSVARSILRAKTEIALLD